MSDQEDDIILSELNDEDLVAQMFDDLYDGLKEEIEEGVNILLERKWEPYQILTEALVGGMTIVGNDFRDGILFVPEVLLAANAMKGGMAILNQSGAPSNSLHALEMKFFSSYLHCALYPSNFSEAFQPTGGGLP